MQLYHIIMQYTKEKMCELFKIIKKSFALSLFKLLGYYNILKTELKEELKESFLAITQILLGFNLRSQQYFSTLKKIRPLKIQNSPFE